mmetsp:Transcript_30833/g.62495  ORF Transcript_30833/g.62495 Transcript_30833/m.62495 type:complete len:247 (-) Transcript_30833:85-825(-)
MPTMQEFKNEVQLGALESALHAAVRDYKAEVTSDESKVKAAQKAELEREVDLLDDDDLDSDLAMIQQQRLREMKAEAQRLQEAQKAGHGQYRDIEEGDFLQEVTTSALAVCHFYHPEFQRCKIVDKHMTEVSRKYPSTKFIKLNAEKAPFFVTKLKIQVLPCIVMFKKGIAVDRIVGFEELGGVDDFSQISLEKRLAEKQLITYKNDEYDSDEEDELRARRGVRGGALYAGSKYAKKYGDHDSDSD